MKIRQILATLGASVLVAGALVTATTQAASAEPQAGSASVVIGQYRPLINVGSGKCLDIQNIDGGRIVQRTCNGTVGQTWNFEHVATHCEGLFCSFQYELYRIRNAGSGQCIDLVGGNSADWTPVNQRLCDNSPQMRWHFTPNGSDPFQLRNERAGTCLDVEWGSIDDGAPLQGFHCTARSNLAQQFTQG